MNKKLLAGVSFAVIGAATFWACGEGNINQMNGDDEVMLRLYGLDPVTGGPSSELITLKNDALASCKEDAGCYVQYQAYLNGEEPIEEDPGQVDDPNQGQQQQNQNQNPSSSASRDPFVIVDKPSSSSMIVVDPGQPSSSSMEIVSNSDIAKECVAEPNPISKGQSAKWKFVPNPDFTGYDPVLMATAATLVWTTPGGVANGAQASLYSAPTTYTESDEYTASVVVTYQGASYPVNCKPLQVDGDPITGCKCTSPEAKVDYLSQPDVEWTVSGCVSNSEINSYVWDGEAGTETFTKTFDAAQDGYAPTLKVGNADKTVVEVQCTSVKTTKGSEYTFDKQDTKIALPAGESSVEFDLPATWHGSTEGYCTFRCDGANQPITITIGTESSKADYSATMSIPVAKTINKTAMTITLDVAANCQVGY